MGQSTGEEAALQGKWGKVSQEEGPAKTDKSLKHRVSSAPILVLYLLGASVTPTSSHLTVK